VYAFLPPLVSYSPIIVSIGRNIILCASAPSNENHVVGYQCVTSLNEAGEVWTGIGVDILALGEQLECRRISSDVTK
jgi:hypothetical protein